MSIPVSLQENNWW